MNLTSIALSLTLLISAVTDLMRAINLGSISGLGALTVFLAISSWSLVLTYTIIPKVVLVTSPLVLFIVLGLISWLWHYSELNPVLTVQNLSVYLSFVGFIILSTIRSSQTYDLPAYIRKNLPRAIKLSVILYSISILIYGFGTGAIMGPRSFALFAVIGLAWFLGAWRYSLNQGLLWAILIIIVIALSLSRSALLTALIMFPLAQISLTSIKSWLRMGLVITLIITFSYLAFTYVEPIRSRFTDVGDNATVGGTQINTSGRSAAWPIAYTSALESPWFGKGPGSVGSVLSKSVGNSFTHPHNDYLRIFHDYGLVGLSLWLVGYGQLIITVWKNWLWADRNDRETGHLHFAALLALIAIAFNMLTDNVIVYIFSMAPLGVLVGASLGSGTYRQRVIKRMVLIKALDYAE